jgi:hypothetical protein
MGESRKPAARKVIALPDDYHSYVLRLRFEHAAGAERVRIRLEDVVASESWNFKDVSTALARLRQRIDHVIADRRI